MKQVISIVSLFMLTTVAIGQISKKVDKTKDEITLRTPISPKVQMVKLIQDYVPTYYIRFKTTTSKLINHITGVFVLFNDGTKWTKADEQVVYKSSKGNEYIYWSSVILTPTDLKLFSTKRIKKYTLYQWEEEMSENLGADFLNNVQMLIVAN